jgi:hypothetical protein
MYCKEQLDCTSTVVQLFTDVLISHDSRDWHCPTFSLDSIYDAFMRYWREDESERDRKSIVGFHFLKAPDSKLVHSLSKMIYNAENT